MEKSQFEFKCPQCGQLVIAEESLRGVVLPCPHCGKGIVVPNKKKPILAPISQASSTAGNDASHNFRAIQRRMGESISEEQLISNKDQEMSSTRKSSPLDLLKVVGIFIAIGVVAFDIFSVRSKNKALLTELEVQKSELDGKIKAIEDEKKNQYSNYEQRLKESEQRVSAANEKLKENENEMADRIRDMEDRHRREINELRLSFDEKILNVKEEQAHRRDKMLEDFNRQKGRMKEELQSLRSAAQTNVGDGETEHQEPPKKSKAELKQQLAANLEEIDKLRKLNPGCVLVESHKQARILETRFRPNQYRQYCSKDQITYVRSLYHCTNCNYDSSKDDPPCCEVSRKRSFTLWRGKVLEAEEAARINARIDELLKENEDLKKAMHGN